MDQPTERGIAPAHPRLSMRPVGGPGPSRPIRRRRWLVRSLVVVVCLSLTLAALYALATFVTRSVFECSPPTAEEQREQEVLVRARVSDAADLSWTIADCDDEGLGFLDFTTALTPEAAIQAFLVDPSCARDGPGVTCRSGRTQISVSFEPTADGRTSGELAV